MIFCVEDDSNIRELVTYTLNNMGMEAVGFEDGTDFFSSLKKETPDLILLDIMLPGEDGLTILRKLKDSSKTREIPVIIMTAKSAEYDIISGLDAGADDYVTKPFGMMELVSRIKAVLRRMKPDEKGKVYQHENLQLDLKKHEVLVDEKPVILTLKEFELLTYLMKNPNIVLTRSHMLESVWGYEFQGETRTLDVHIRSLRQKLGSAGEHIHTVRGVGYRLGGKHENQN